MSANHDEDEDERVAANAVDADAAAKGDGVEDADAEDDDEDDAEDGDDDAEDGDDDAEDAEPTAGGDLAERRRQIRRRRRRTREELRLGALMFPPVDDQRPKTRAECAEELRPCPWVACKFHLYLDVNPETGSIKINFPDLEPWEMRDTCALDVAERGGSTLDEVGEVTNLTRERIRQLEVRGLLKLKGLSRELR
jgi:hypothetical protein